MARLYTVADAKRRRTAADAWLERMNPLRGLSIRQAENIYDAARGGTYALLHLLYSEIEKTDPVLLTCVERRAAALAGLGWKADTVAGADAGLAKEQSAAIGELIAGIGNFEEALEHLDGGFFRGFAHAEPVHGPDGSVRSLLLPESWNFCRAPGTGAWWWNPDALTAEPGMGGMAEIPSGRLVTVCRPRAIDYPALSIYLRCALAERDWGRFVERYGLPPAILTAPANTTKEQETMLAAAAGDVADGRSGVVPNGTSINFATEARGTDPFTAFITHQEKLVVLLATGGTLTSLAEAGSGTLAGNAQMDVWRQIVSRDAAIIGAALDRTLVQPYLRARFPGRPAAASFALGADRDLSAEEVFEVAAKARTAGYVVAEADLEGRTGFALEREQDAPGMGAAGTGGLFNARVPDGMPLQSPAIPLQNARTGEGATTGRPGEKPPSAGLLEPSAPGEGETRLARAMQRDLRPAARIIAEALRTHDWKAARKQLAGALKECGTESAEALEAAMRAAGEKAWPETHAEEQRGGGAEGVANSECRAKDPAHCRTHGTPEGKKEKGNMPRNDGKIHFGSGVAREKADRQSKDLGYAGIDDLMQKSTGVEQATIDSILGGGSEPCEPHEAVAALRTCASIPSGVEGEPAVKLGERPLRHYICGEGRHHGGEPDVKRLKTLPQAIQAIRHPDSYHHELNQKPIVKFPGESLPKGAQTVYQYKAGKTFAYADSGVLTGWQNY